MLAELEEIIQYKRLYDQPKAQAFIRKTWISRIKGCQRNVEVWQRILKVRALVVSPKDDKEIWIKFANLCRKSGRLSLSYKTLSSLLNVVPQNFNSLNLEQNSPHVVYGCIKHLWATNSKETAFNQMKEFSKTMVSRLEGKVFLDSGMDVVLKNENFSEAKLNQLLARCYLKLGDWELALNEELNEVH